MRKLDGPVARQSVVAFEELGRLRDAADAAGYDTGSLDIAVDALLLFCMEAVAEHGEGELV